MDPANRPTVLDPEVIATLKELGGDDEPELFIELVDLFIEDTCDQLAQASEALERGDSEEMRRRAHTLKSSCANVGAVNMSKLCFQIEQHALAQELEHVRELLTEALSEFDDVKAALLTERG